MALSKWWPSFIRGVSASEVLFFFTSINFIGSFRKVNEAQQTLDQGTILNIGISYGKMVYY